jgi:flagellar hook-associated protein 3 FlgL
MRISTSMLYDSGVAGIQQREQQQIRLQQQMSSGLRMVSPSDDPVAAAAALEVKQSLALNTQQHVNGDSVKSQLGLEENALSDLTALLQDVKTLAINAGNPALSNAERTSLAAELDGRYQELIGIANRDDGNGNYLFSGYQGATRPFVEVSGGNVVYNGDAGQRLVQIGPNRTIAANDSGDSVFRAIRTGNGTFTASAAAGNTGGGVIDAGVVNDPSKWNVAGNARDFSIKFDVTGGVTTYDIVDNVNNVSLLTGAAPAAGPYLRTFVPGGAISLATQAPPDTNPAPFDFGASVSVGGAPNSGDSFDLNASTNQDMFATLHNMVTTLRTGASAAAASMAGFQGGINAGLSNIDNALNNVLAVRASVGARLKEVDNAQSSSENVALQYAKTLSGLQDLDYTKAISDLSQQQVILQAAQQSFLRITKLNLFDLL